MAKKIRKQVPRKSTDDRLRDLERRVLTLERIVAHEANDTVWPMPEKVDGND